MSKLLLENKMREMASETNYNYEDIHNVFSFIKNCKQKGYKLDMTLKQCMIFDLMIERGIIK